MFLFRKKKENNIIKPESEKTAASITVAPADRVVDKSAKPNNSDKPAKGVPVRVVTPNSEAKKDLKRSLPVSPAGLVDKSQNPDEIADSLLVKVEPNPEIENAVDDAVIAAVLKPVTESERPPANVPVSVSAAPRAATTPAFPGSAAPAVEGKAVALPEPAPVQAAGAVQLPKPAEKSAEKPPEGVKKEAPDGAKKEAPSEDKGSMLSNLFGKADVEEETYLDRLIKSLPDVSLEEVVNEADEVNNIMNDWLQSQKVNLRKP